MQAVGNDFIVIAEPENLDLSTLALSVCHRRFGIGADGLLTYRPLPQSNGVQFRIFNADGSEDTMCGNGLRCVVKLAVERGQILREGVAHTLAGLIPYSVNSPLWSDGAAKSRWIDLSGASGGIVSTIVEHSQRIMGAPERAVKSRKAVSSYLIIDL